MDPLRPETTIIAFLVPRYDLIHCNLHFDLTNINHVGRIVQYSQRASRNNAVVIQSCDKGDPSTPVGIRNGLDTNHMMPNEVHSAPQFVG